MKKLLFAKPTSKLCLFLFLLFFLIFKPSTTFAVEINTQTELEKQTLQTINQSVVGERIEDFQADIAINKNGSINVTETIIYFFDTPRHGIFRNIPFTKRDDQNKRLDLAFDDFKVADENGKKYKFEKTKEGEELIIKIGDPNKTIEGKHVYKISYSVKGALGYFEDHDELYWNATGNGWDVPIKNAGVNITLPEKLTENGIKLACYTGVYGSDKQNCTATSDGKNTKFESTLFLNSYEGLTIVKGFPKGTVAVLNPEIYVPFFERWYGKITLVGIIIAAFLWYLVLPIYLIIKWYRHGRDPDVGIATTATYDPPKVGKRFLTPAETGALLDETVDKRDIFSTIVDLAHRGHLKISEPKTKEFHLIKSDSKSNVIPHSMRDPVPLKKDILLPFEQTLYDGLFADGDDVELKKVKLYVTVAAVETELYQLMVKHDYFPKNPRTTRSLYYGLGGLALFTANFVLAFIAFVFGRVMPRKTLLGAQTARKAQGLKNFLTSQERQLNYQGDKQLLFERLLPYASAFGVEKAWARRFEKFDLKNPDWYQGTTGTHFSAIYLASSMSNSYNNFAVSSTPPSSSGSGFSGGSSGGGGGGGGGGSW